MEKENIIGSVDAILDEKYGKVGTHEREQFRKEARAYCGVKKEDSDYVNKGTIPIIIKYYEIKC